MTIPDYIKTTINALKHYFVTKDDVLQLLNGNESSCDHAKLINRDEQNQHPISAITGLQSALDSKADNSDIKPLDGYATERWVEDKGYLTEHQDISGKANVGDYYTKEESDNRYITEYQSLDGYATTEYVDNYHDDTKQDTISDIEEIRSGADKGVTAVQPEDLPDYPETEDVQELSIDTEPTDGSENLITSGAVAEALKNAGSGAGGGGGTWSLLSDIVVAEDVTSVEQQLPSPKRKIRIVIQTEGVEQDTNYTRINIRTGDASWNHNFYIDAVAPLAAPRKANAIFFYDVELFEFGGKVWQKSELSYVEGYNLSINSPFEWSGSSFSGCEPKPKHAAMYIPFDSYENYMNPTITSVYVLTYGIFKAGTHVQIWGWDE